MLKTRCPACSKLYAVDRGDVAGQEAPQFECSSCRTRFAMPIPEVIDETAGAQEIKSIVVQWKAMPEIVDEKPQETFRSQIGSLEVIEETEPCLKCGFENALRSKECMKCGVIFSRVNESAEAKFRVKGEVLSAWEDVLADYTNLDKHQEFAQKCYENGCMPFAAFKYQSILDADPGEDMAEKMREYVLVLATTPVEQAKNFKLEFSQAKLGKILKPLFIVIGFVFAMGHLMTGQNELRLIGSAFLVVGVLLYALKLWKSYGIKVQL